MHILPSIFFEELLNTFYTDLNLVSTAIQRLHLSEFEFYFKVASTFMSTDTLSSTESQQQKYNRRKLQKDNKTDKTFTFITIPSPPSSFVSSLPSSNSPQNSSSSLWSWMRMSTDHQAVCLMLLLPPVVIEEDECRPPGWLLDVVASHLWS